MRFFTAGSKKIFFQNIESFFLHWNIVNLTDTGSERDSIKGCSGVSTITLVFKEAKIPYIRFFTLIYVYHGKFPHDISWVITIICNLSNWLFNMITHVLKIYNIMMYLTWFFMTCQCENRSFPILTYFNKHFLSTQYLVTCFT